LSVIEDDTKGAGYDEIAEGTLIFSPDRRHLAYAARNGSKWLLVSDGRPSPEYDEVIKNSLVFSSDGNHVAYAVRVGNLSWTIVDGHSSAKYSSVLGGTMSFGQGGRLEFLSVKPTQVPQGNGSQKYELLDHPAEDYGIEAELSVTEEVQASDCSGDIEGKVELLEAGGRILDLNTPEIVHEDGKAWIVTRDYGKIRVSGGYAGDRPPSGLCFWLTQAQKAQLNPLFGSLYRVQFAP
jgi:hypothetical protein